MHDIHPGIPSHLVLRRGCDNLAAWHPWLKISWKVGPTGDSIHPKCHPPEYLGIDMDPWRSIWIHLIIHIYYIISSESTGVFVFFYPWTTHLFHLSRLLSERSCGPKRHSIASPPGWLGGVWTAGRGVIRWLEGWKESWKLSRYRWWSCTPGCCSTRRADEDDNFEANRPILGSWQWQLLCQKKRVSSFTRKFGEFSHCSRITSQASISPQGTPFAVRRALSGRSQQCLYHASEGKN